MGLSRETSPYTTDNVHRACSSGFRKKRQVPMTGCLALKREEDDTVVVEKAKVQEIIMSKTTLMQEHLTSIHKIS
uniref:Uncharacterized protein n=1 Tax=Romanomermis culicivorax TaxID=13658 RepID=A0A915LA33_ROMCU